ncbi:MAG: hypothetical protein JSU92_06045 [Deltaproteobacteria bacterium]|nr:MAG: hypothetical protein JSU92_06045 [Deltaproteobacteria bacterium]
MAPGEQASVKGSLLLGLLKYAGEKLGEEGREKLLESLDDEDRAILYKTADSSEPAIISLAEWYPHKIFKDLMDTLIREVGKGDVNLSKEIGYWAGERDLDPNKGLYSFYTTDAYKGDITMVYKTSASAIWGQMYNKGKFEPEVIEKGMKIILKLRDFPEVTEAGCLLVGAWIERTSQIFSGAEIKVDTKYRPATDIDCEFHIELKSA